MAENDSTPRQHTDSTSPEGASISSIANSVHRLTLTPKSSRVTGTSFRQASQVSGRRVLFATTSHEPETTVMKKTSDVKWSTDECRALISFLLLYTDGLSWSCRKDLKFWTEAGVFVQQQTKSLHCRSGKACRSKVTVTLIKKFKSPADAEKFYLGSELPTSPTPPISTSPSLSHSSSPAPMDTLRAVATSEQVVSSCYNALSCLQTTTEQVEVLSSLFSCYLSKHSDVRIPDDFVQLAINGMKYLHVSGRSNVIYLLAKAVGTMRKDNSDSLLPIKRMPMGLVEYIVNFFTSSSIQKVQCPHDYRLWQQTMYVLFGTKWTKVFTGPMWSHVSIMQAEDADATLAANPMNPVNALVNVPGLSDRTMRRDIASGDISTGSEIQLAVLQTAVGSNPNAKWWIKADGVDVVKGLCESTKGVWSGDVDLNDGKLSLLYQDLTSRLKWISGIGLKERRDQQLIKKDLGTAMEKVVLELKFVHSELKKFNTTYEENLKSGKAKDKAMFSLSWDIEELKKLSSEGRRLRIELSTTLDTIDDHRVNLPLKLTSIRNSFGTFIKEVTRYKRTEATHMFVMMISCDLRNTKPYALPVQCLPYAGMSEANLRRLVNSLVGQMVNHGMKVAGFVSDGEFNYMRSKGYTRPLSILQVRTNVRNKYNKLTQETMMSMLTPIYLPDGSIEAECVNPAVPCGILEEIREWLNQGVTLENAVDRLRPRTVPSGHEFHTWQPGMTECFTQKMRSILAQYEYTYRICKWDDEGVPFRTYLYVPEIHPITGMPFCEREDEAHVLKRIAKHTRNGGPDNLHLERFTEALADPSSDLTYPALTGARKQSVVDAERLFNPNLSAFMKRKGYKYEATYIECVGNWRRACDERGLSELTRCKFNYQFLNLILSELMPWFSDSYDFCLLEVNRPISSILGFSRETLVALVTNIEGREWRRRMNTYCNDQPEHPRASSTDDVECFFSVLRDTIGRNFTVKQVKYGFRKASFEFMKRLDPDLPFYYHTSSHDRFYEGPLTDFNKSVSRKKHKRVPRREQPAAFSVRRATMPVRGSLGVRPQFHNKPLELPPINTDQIHVVDHSYNKIKY